MFTVLEKPNKTIDGLPDITNAIIETYAHYDKAVEDAAIICRDEHIKMFVDAWFQCQKDHAIRLYFGQKSLSKQSSCV
jgi:hypothetical protein